MTPRDLALLYSLFSRPAAPFREQHVAAWVDAVIGSVGIPHFTDPLGNIIVGANSAADYQRLLHVRDAEPVRVFIAHMDHPGFHGVRWVKPKVLRVQWHGGSPTRHLHGARVWLADAQGVLGEGRMRHAKLRKEGWAIDTADVHFTQVIQSPRLTATELYGGFKFRKPVWQQGARIYTQAADDLVGVFCIVATALEAFRRHGARGRPPFLGLLTRAEEVGLVGAVGHFELGWLQRATRPVVCVSLEASRTLPGAIVGQGPIVRLGDRRTPFDQDHLQVLTELAQKVLPGRHQRRVMDGGSCEGSAATVYGFPTIALAVPLGNYHNQGLQGGPDCRGAKGPAPEFVHQDDVAGQLRLCIALMRAGLPWAQPWRTVRARLRRNLRDYRSFL
jgi:putative aminopeptidase FrvX